tara:strand:+ start:1603 stop:1941 length:339 start_codon:yes stop_codon:yes gene_type:complete
MAVKKYTGKNNARKAARDKVQETRSKAVGLAQKGLRANTDKEIANAARKRNIENPDDDTKSQTTVIENRGKARTAGLPVGTPKKNLKDSIKAAKKVKVAKKKRVAKTKKRKT